MGRIFNGLRSIKVIFAGDGGVFYIYKYTSALLKAQTRFCDRKDMLPFSQKPLLALDYEHIFFDTILLVLPIHGASV